MGIFVAIINLFAIYIGCIVVIDVIKKRKLRIKKYKAISKLSELTQKLYDFTASINDKDAWEASFDSLSQIELERYEEHLLEQFKDAYKIYIILYCSAGVAEYKEVIAARERLLTTALWDAYRLINRSSAYEKWLISVEEIIDMQKSNENVVSIKVSEADVEAINQLINSAYEYINDLRKNNFLDDEWIEDCNKSLERLRNARKFCVN